VLEIIHLNSIDRESSFLRNLCTEKSVLSLENLISNVLIMYLAYLFSAASQSFINIEVMTYSLI